MAGENLSFLEKDDQILSVYRNIKIVSLLKKKVNQTMLLAFRKHFIS